MFEKIKALSRLNGISGDEDQVRNWIISQIAPYCQYQVDNLGNIICLKKGMIIPNKKLMISAHMDEVGLIVTNITEDGLLKFTTVGGVDDRVILGRAVSLYRSGLKGVIGTKAIHQQSGKERETAVKAEEMFIDIGASSKEEALEQVKPGDSVAFLGDCEEFGDGYLKGKALDDRIGCALLIQMIQSKLKYDTYFVFAVQEEIGLRGAKAAAYSVDPDLSIVVEATTAADLSDVPEEKKVCRLGQGAVVGFMDRSTIYNRELYDIAFALAHKYGIPCQTKTMVAGGNDAGAIHTTRGGVKTIAVSVPCRYLHSPYCVVKQEDVESTARMVQTLAENLL